MLTDNKITAWTNPIVNEADRPQRSAAEMKSIFDSNSNQLKEAFNALIDALISANAASELGAATGTIQSTINDLWSALGAAVEECKTYTDNASFAAGAADMRAGVYDPQGMRRDVFAYALEQAQAEAGKRAAPSQAYVVSVPASGWSASEPYTQTVAVTGMPQPQTTPLAGVLLSDDAGIAAAEQEAWNEVGRVDVGSQSVTLTCYDNAPETDMNIRLVVIG